MYHKNYFTAKKIAKYLGVIEPLVYRKKRQLADFRYLALDKSENKKFVETDLDDSKWAVISQNTYWGQRDQDFVLRTHFSVPADWDKKNPVALFLPLGEAGDFSHPEALAYIDSEPYSSCDRHHQEIILPARWRSGKSHTLAMHGWTGSSYMKNPSSLFMRPCFVVQIDQPTRDFIASARVALGASNGLDENDPAKGKLLNALNDAFKGLDTHDPLGDGFYQSVAEANKILCKGIKSAGRPLDVDLTAAGHAHIDVAWLWPLRQTRRKSGRTFYNAIRLMEQFKDFHFLQSQPQLYDYLLEDYPELFEEIKKAVARGNWEVTGGMWVEADTNISGAEAMARQFLLGRGFFKKHFGADAETPVLWLPDVFGYSACLPQLAKEAGMKYFFTTKMSWNQYNRIPYDTFWWQGIDGTKILTHFATTPQSTQSQLTVGTNHTYNAMVDPQQVIGTWNSFQQKEHHQQLLIAFGFGDGGGGPTREMLENIREMSEFPSAPQIRCGKAGDFFEKLEKTTGDVLPGWNGEFYPEFHRGTFTTQSRNKRANRKSEFMLHDAEFAAAMASTIDDKYNYPHDQLHKAWKLVCLNQFHDIIPGSSINEVYVESLQDYEKVYALAREVKDSACSAIAKNTGGDLVLVNPTSFRRNDLAVWNGKLDENQHLETADGKPVPTQDINSGTLIAGENLAPYGACGLKIASGKAAEIKNTLVAKADLLENQFVQVKFNAAGDITSIYDKINNRQLLAAGQVANQFQAFEDRPLAADAWDIDIYYEDKKFLAEPASSIKVVEAGPLRATLEIQRQILSSNYTQRISISQNIARIDFDTVIDWNQQNIFLKSAFPVDILSSKATYEIQWGNIERTTHKNTSWDWAQFEVWAQKWADLSESDYGVSLLNDCKYGYDIKDNLMRISLLRGTTTPDHSADQGRQEFCYSLLGHSGPVGQTTLAEAYCLNDAIMLVENDSKTQTAKTVGSFLSVDGSDLVIETIKKAEDGKGIIVRLYQSQRKRGTVTLTAGFKIAEVYRSNLLEENLTKLEHSANEIKLSVRPFEIITLRIIAG
ncbi:MAG: glycoside hydrolase family 38 C-terminal domain-containing protein [Phycisphaerae bacterium]|nr:glycoside hydrolase family 38 C-terminal domain-containing protein [Phycisphaerae bacterium]